MLGHVYRRSCFKACEHIQTSLKLAACRPLYVSDVASTPAAFGRCSGTIDTRLYPVRYMSSGKRNFIADFIDNIKHEMNKNKEMKDSLKKFREEADKLEKSESLQKAREKYVTAISIHGTGTVRKDKTVVGGPVASPPSQKRPSMQKQRPTKPVILTGSANWYSFAGGIKCWDMFTSAGWQQQIESETLKSSEALKKTLSTVQEKLKATMEEVEKSEYAQKGRKLVEDVSKTVERTAESVSKQGEQLSQSSIFQSVQQGVKSVKEEIDESSAYSRGNLYQPPEKLRKRSDVDMSSSSDKVIEPNTDASGVVLHKDSQWFQSWQSFKDNNQFVHKLFDMKTKYEESDHIFFRATRTFTDKLSELFGGVFSKTEMSEVLTEIVRMDPTFDKEQFIKECRFDIIPNILESMVRGDLEILKDWCYEAAFNVIATPIRQAQAASYKLDNHVLDINHVDIVAGKMMEQGPVLVLSFTAQQTMCVRDVTGRVVEGDPEKIMRIFYVWAFCRDQAILDPRAAWRLIDLSASPMEQWM